MPVKCGHGLRSLRRTAVRAALVVAARCRSTYFRYPKLQKQYSGIKVDVFAKVPQPDPYWPPCIALARRRTLARAGADTNARKHR